MPKQFSHRVSIAATIFLDVVTSSADSTLEDLEPLIKAQIRRASGDDSSCIADIGLRVDGICNGRAYIGAKHCPNRCSDNEDRLELESYEDCQELGVDGAKA